MTARSFDFAGFDCTGDGSHDNDYLERAIWGLRHTQAIDLNAIGLDATDVQVEIAHADGDALAGAVFRLEGSISGINWTTITTFSAGAGVKPNVDISPSATGNENWRYLRPYLDTVQATVTDRPIANIHIRLRGGAQ